MDQIFAERLAEAGWDKTKLVALMNELDEEKRSLRISLRRIAQDPEYSMAGRERQNKERRIKDKERYLIEERDIVRQRIERINRERKAMNKARNREQDFPASFVAAAEEMLDSELFSQLELRAVEIIQSLKTE